MTLENILKFFRAMKQNDQACDATMIGQLLIKQSHQVHLSDELMASLADTNDLPDEQLVVHLDTDPGAGSYGLMDEFSRFMQSIGDAFSYGDATEPRSPSPA
mmetsp:Transcript_135023/g.305664  ORF Transcript_135023/g.305664 Transcript_135023/m.305664 type:complete len:102 (+) Transcript_135023:894-1199(+)